MTNERTNKAILGLGVGCSQSKAKEHRCKIIGYGIWISEPAIYIRNLYFIYILALVEISIKA